MPKRSSNSAGAVYLDREARLSELEAVARRAAERMPAIRRIVLFGSLVSGIPTPRSDADLLVEISSSPLSGPDRIPDVMRALMPAPCPLDLHIYTSAELKQSMDSPLVRRALSDGRVLFQR